ncbi:DNA primase [bacterium]|nr:DNA primase [bacterium]
MNTDIQEIKARADIVAIISRYVKLKKAGRNFTGLCPFHVEKTPSFSVNPSLGIFKCFGCGQSGDVIKFIQEIEHIEFPQALEKLADELGITLQKSDDPSTKLIARYRKMYTVTAELYHYILLNLEQGKEALEYVLKRRRLTEATVIANKIGYAPYDNKLLQNYLIKKGFTPAEIKDAGFINERGNDKYTDRLMFPIFDTAGHVVGFSGRVISADDRRPKYLNSAESILFKKRFLLFGLNSAKEAIAKKDIAILCEGQLDAITSQQAGIENIVAPLGTGLTDTQLSLLSRYSNNVAFCFDNDEAGQKSMLRGVQLALSQGMTPFIISLPEDVKDIDELIQKRPDDWKDRAINPRDFFLVQISTLRSLMKKDILIFEKKLQEVLSVLSNASELKQSIVAKQFAESLGLSEQGLLSSIQKTAPPSFIRQELKQRQGALSTSEYVLGMVLLFPLVTLLMGKTEIAKEYFPLKDQQELFEKLTEFAQKHSNLVTSVLDKTKKSITVSWESIYTRFTNEVALDFSTWIAKVSEERPGLAGLIERIGLSEMTASIVITDDIVTDFFRAWGRLKKQAVTLRLEILKKRMVAAELANIVDEISVIQEQIQANMELLRKIEKKS